MVVPNEPSRACATVTAREPAPRRTQKVVRLSAIEPLSTFTSYAYCVSSVATRRPKPPACAAAETTDEVPVPCGLFQFPAVRFPDSKPSEKIVSVYWDSAARG